MRSRFYTSLRGFFVSINVFPISSVFVFLQRPPPSSPSSQLPAMVLEIHLASSGCVRFLTQPFVASGGACHYAADLSSPFSSAPDDRKALPIIRVPLISFFDLTASVVPGSYRSLIFFPHPCVKRGDEQGPRFSARRGRPFWAITLRHPLCSASRCHASSLSRRIKAAPFFFFFFLSCFLSVLSLVSILVSPIRVPAGGPRAPSSYQSNRGVGLASSF